jgi:hypothetical protein
MERSQFIDFSIDARVLGKRCIGPVVNSVHVPSRRIVYTDQGIPLREAVLVTPLNWIHVLLKLVRRVVTYQQEDHTVTLLPRGLVFDDLVVITQRHSAKPDVRVRDYLSIEYDKSPTSLSCLRSVVSPSLFISTLFAHHLQSIYNSIVDHSLRRELKPYLDRALFVLPRQCRRAIF